EPPIVPGPGTGSIEALVDNNRLLRSALDLRIGDMRLHELVAATRREVLMVAAEYTSHYRDVTRPGDMADWISRPLIAGGHQPELFHPGVWLKNAVLDAYARQVGGTAVNLVIDSDRCGRAAVDVPLGTPADARLEPVPFDAQAPEMAWEERPILDQACLASFGERASALLVPLVPDAILRRFWPLVVDRAKESHRLGLAIAQARHIVEERFGLETLELPVGELVKLPTVMVFTGWLLAHCHALHESYNAALASHRRARKVRGRGRPMPDLAVRHDSAGEWIEVPWWLWSKEDPRRRRVYASVSPGALALSDMETVRVELPIAPDTSPSKWIDALSRMEEHGIRLRPRALVTTLIARLLFADVFVHGIGGAAYDTLTDDIVRRLVGSDPPRHAVVSGTLRLPLEGAFPGFDTADPRGDLAAVRRTLRDIAYHPEKHLSDDGDLPAAVRDVIVAKRRWVETVPTPALARRRCHEIRAANIRLAGHAAPEVRDLEFQVAALGQAVKAWRVLAARTHPWCFFPEKTLRSFLLLENA
ncbi:MAG: hypothetical protein EBX35_08520, partial [Planctomycetia bacterium]|nr:hypothetical protein [Planctomycetia bacterium]